SRTSARNPHETSLVVELITPDRWAVFHDGEVFQQGRNSLGEIPLAHVQNVPVPFSYGGVSDLEPLLPLQDQLNTRLSDRACRITMQSFRMYLGKGIDGFTDQPVAPGRMWISENPDAEVIEFGGDAACPSEDSAIREIREAMDKTSGVSPIAAGAIKGRIGRLTSAAALRVTMLALLARTERKRATYGAGIARLCELALRWLDRAGLFPTTPSERAIEIHWPNPIPLNEIEQIQQAQAKLSLGVPREMVLRELGYTGNVNGEPPPGSSGDDASCPHPQVPASNPHR
ncbi:MAG: phage portal protein, partial [Phycisphaerae bacterium]|nr:phage portal protein [Phycisphaerae bacterium]MDW8263621.1 phage portal protein [Phycisphaerales bacterium]